MSRQDQYFYATCIDFYDLLAREGPAYAYPVEELSEIRSHWKDSLRITLGNVDNWSRSPALVQIGNVISARKVMDGMSQIFGGVPYRTNSRTDN